MKAGITGIIGEGKMGTNLIHYLLESGSELRWVISPRADTGKIIKNFEKKISRLRDHEIISETRYSRLLTTRISADSSILEDCSLVIEAVTENKDIKRQVLGAADAILSDTAILVSNSSSINPSALCPSTAREENFAGLHFFYPVNLVNIVEIIKAPLTSAATVDELVRFLSSVNRKYLILEEKESFILNRIFLDVQNEAYRLVEHGQSTPLEIDNIVKVSLFPSGIFEIFDHVGLDTMLQSILNYTSDYPHVTYYHPLISRLRQLISEGRLGKKSGRGFFDYGSIEPGTSSAVIDPEQSLEILHHLEFTYKNAARRFITHSGLTIDELNEALKEYFGTEKGPFD